jgi:hypothetical protein
MPFNSPVVIGRETVVLRRELQASMTHVVPSCKPLIWSGQSMSLPAKQSETVDAPKGRGPAGMSASGITVPKNWQFLPGTHFRSAGSTGYNVHPAPTFLRYGCWWNSPHRFGFDRPGAMPWHIGLEGLVDRGKRIASLEQTVAIAEPTP